MLAASSYLNLAPNDPLLHDPGFQKREARFFRSIVTSSGARKTTEPHRLDAVNQALFDLLSRLDLRPRIVCDIGISSGITTLEWLDEFQRKGLPVQMIATDLTMTVNLWRLNRFAKVLTERNGHILQAELFGSAISTTRRRDYFTGVALFKWALFRAIKRSLKTEPGPHTGIAQGATFPLVSPLLRGRPNVRLLDHDILHDAPPLSERSADIVRIANLLQRSYFDQGQIQRIVSNVRHMCHEGSIIIVCRNAESHIEASFFRIDNEGKFSVETRIGSGSEVEREFVTAPAATSPAGHGE